MKIKVAPDAAHANDKYTFTNWRVYVRTGSDPGTPGEGSGEDIHLTSTFVKLGDIIVVKIGNVVRIDASGKREKLTLDTESKYLSIAVK